MDPALEEIEFLALSENRVAVLEALGEAPRSRQELGVAVDASQPTIGRVLGDFTDRRWIAHDGDRYEVTATGRLVAEQFLELRETVATEVRLREVVPWLPTAELDVDLRRLSDATLTTPSQTRPDAPVKRVLDLLRDADEVRVTSHAFNEQSLDVVEQRVVEGEQSFRGVFSPDALDALAADPALGRRLRRLAAADGAEIRRSDGEIPVAVTATEDAVHLLLRDDDGLLRAGLDTDDERVAAWADETHERYWRDAQPLDADSFGP
jgi:predicted transcriptional regulator